MMTGRLALTLLIFLVSVLTLFLLSSLMLDVLPDEVIAIMGILTAILFKVPDLIDWLNKRPALQEGSQSIRTTNPGTQAEPLPAGSTSAPPASQESPQVIPPVLEDWDRMEPGNHATLVITRNAKELVDIRFNPPPMRVSDKLVADLMQGLRAITEGPVDPAAALGIGNRIFKQMFPAQNAAQIDTEKGDLFVYYPFSPDDLGTITYELIRKWGSEWGVLRLPNGKPGDAHAVTLRRLLATFHAPARFRLLIVVHLDQQLEDVGGVLDNWLACLPEGVEMELYAGERATPGRVKNLIAGGGYDAIYMIGHHEGGKLKLHQGELDLRELSVKDNPLVFLNACKAANIDSRAVRVLLEGGAGFVIGTLNKVDAVEAIKFGGLFFDALFGSSAYHDWLNRNEHFGLRLPDRPLPVARALSWARRCLERQSGIVWSYVLFGQPDARKLEKLIRNTAQELRRYGRWKAFVEVLGCIQPDKKVRPLVRTEIKNCLAAGDWDTIEEMLELPPPYLEDLCEEVESWVKEKFAKREWEPVIERAKVLQQLGLNAAEQAEKAARADQLVEEVKQDLKK